LSGAGPASLPGLPRDADGPVFRAPWEAQAFALALALHEQGIFSWPEWAAALSQQIARAQAAGDPDTGATYYRHWLAALESLVLGKGRPGAGQLQSLSRAWAAAAARTPHGRPIELTPAERSLAR
jgi:nitrile hydratase accessory protein